MRTALHFCTLLCIAFGFGGTASAQALQSANRNGDCNLKIDTATTNWVIRGFDPFAATPPVASFDILFVNDGARECRFYPVFETDQALLGLRAGNGAPVTYTLVDETGNYDATPIGGRTVRRVTNPAMVVPPRGQRIGRYTVRIDTDQLNGDGLFSQTLILRAETTDGDPIAERQVVLGIDVLPSAVMSLAGSFTRVNGRADVDLGDLSEGIAQVPLRLNVQSTRAFHLGVMSQNDGRLRLGAGEWSIPYQLVIDGRPATMNSDRSYTTDSRPGNRNDSLPLQFAIGSTAQKRAGVYSDVLTISVAVD